MQLQENIKKFEAEDIGLVVVTYDSEEDQQKFIKRYGIEFPLMSDIEASTVTALGILNEQNEKDSMAYGVPHPGFFVLDTKGTIRHRSFLDGYQQRLDANTVLAMANTALSD